MSKTKATEQTQVRKAIKEYMDAGHAANTTDIAEYVKEAIGLKPSRTTIGTILRELGYEPIEQPRWVWKK